MAGPQYTARALDWEERRTRFNRETLNMAYTACLWALADIRALDGEVVGRAEMEQVVMDARRAISDALSKLTIEAAAQQALSRTTIKY